MDLWRARHSACMRRSAFAATILSVAAIAACAEISGLNEYGNCTGECDSGPSINLEPSGLDGSGRSDGDESFDVIDAPMGSPDVVGGADATLATDDASAELMDGTMSTVSIADVIGVPSDSPETAPFPDSAQESQPRGRECRYADGGLFFCAAGQHCCVNSIAQQSECSSSCGPSEYPVDCVGATGADSDASLCGSETCCGTLVLNGGIAPNCTSSELTTSCMSECLDSPPQNCLGPYTIRVCGTAADCAGDLNNPSCCRFGSSPVYWCVSAPTMVAAAACRP
jgi:hypothetical protein